MITITSDLVLILLMGIGNVTYVCSEIIVMTTTVINWATVTLLRQYLLHYTRQIMTCEPIDII